MLLVVALSIAAIVTVPMVLFVRAQRAKRRAAASVVVIDGREIELQTAVWAVASSGAVAQVGGYLVDTRFKEAQQVADGLSHLVENLSADEQYDGLTGFDVRDGFGGDDELVVAEVPAPGE